MSVMNCIQLAKSIAKLILNKRHAAPIDANFNIECNRIDKMWNRNAMNSLCIQFYLKSHPNTLIEEWNFYCEVQMTTDDVQHFLSEIKSLTELGALSKSKDPLDHIIFINEKKRVNWVDAAQLQSKSVAISNKITINIAYLESLPIFQDNDSEFPFFGRGRFASEEFNVGQTQPYRKTSYHDLDSKRVLEKNQAILQKLSKKHKHSDSFSSSSSRNQSQQQLLTIVNKKEDVEILSSVDDARKIINDDSNGDFEIEMIIEEPVVMEQTIIIKQNSTQDRVFEQLSNLKTKSKKKSSQIADLLEQFNQQH